MPGAPRSIFVGGGIQPGAPFTLNSFLYVSNITPPTASTSVARVATDGAVTYVAIGAGYVASPGAAELFRTKNGIISEGTATDSVVMGRGASAGGAVGRSIALGTLANAANSNNIAIGYNASTGGTADTIAIGAGCALVNAGGLVFGTSAYGQGNAGGAMVVSIGPLANAQASNAGGQDSLAIGWLAIARTYDTVIGNNAQSNVQSVFGNANTVVGRNSTSNVAQGANTVIGASNTASAQFVVIVGQGSSASAAANRALIFGSGNAATHSHVVLVGHGAPSFQANTAVLGGTDTIINTVVIGSGNTMAAPAAKTLRWTNATGVDNAAGNVTFVAPLSTGAATEATFSIAVGTVQAAGATQHVATNRISFTPGGVVWNETVAPAGAAAVYATGSRGRHVYYGNAASGDAFSNRQVITAGAAGFIGYRGDGTIAAPTALVANDTILNVGGAGYDGTSWGVVTQGLMRVVAAENWSNTARGTRLEFRTTKNTTTAETTVVTFENDGSVTMNPITAGTAAINLGANALTNAGGAGAGTLNNLPAAVVAGNPAVYVVFNVNGTPTYFPGWQ